MSQADPSATNTNPLRSSAHLPLIAYHTADLDDVISIYNVLNGRGVKTWIDVVEQRPGTDWSVGFEQALKKSTVVVVFCSPNGVGPWQAHEFRAIHTECVERGVHIVPAVLPGGQIPDDPLFKRLQKVTFEHVMDAAALDKLQFGITGTKRPANGHFDLVAKVNGDEEEFKSPSCFLAVSHATSREIYEIMMDAAEDAGLKVRQPREFIPEDFEAFAPDVALAIRRATVIIADGTPKNETEKPDADVMYEVGLAEAFAKPVVFVTTPKIKPIPLQVFVCDDNCSLVEYDPDEVNYSGPLRERVSNKLQRIVENSRPPHLVPRNNIGVSVAYSNMVHHRAIIWQPFEQIMQYGLKVKRVFADILKHLYGLQETINVAQSELMAGDSADAVNSRLKRFERTFEGFCDLASCREEIHVDTTLDGNSVSEESIAELRQEDIAVTDSLSTLLNSVSEGGDDFLTVKQIMESTIKYHEILNVYLDQYLDALHALVRFINEPSDRLPRHVIRLHGEVGQLVANAELVPVHACEMMVQMLCLVGLHKNKGEMDHD